MSDSRTLLQLRTDARARADMEVGQFITDAVLTNWINLAISELRELMIAEMGDDWLATVTGNLVTIANTDRYALPADFFKLLGVDVSFDSGTTWTELDRFEFAERNRGHTNGYWDASSLPRYRMFGSNIMFRPTPAGIFTYRLWYAPTFTRLAADGDVFDFVHGWDDWVCCRAAIRMLQKEESDTSAQERDLGLILPRIIAACRNRDAGTPKRIQDTARLSFREGRGMYDEGRWE